jgi:hypothetical protein
LKPQAMSWNILPSARKRLDLFWLILRFNQKPLAILKACFRLPVIHFCSFIQTQILHYNPVYASALLNLLRLIALSFPTCCTCQFSKIQSTHFLIRGPSFIAFSFHYWTYCGIPSPSITWQSPCPRIKWALFKLFPSFAFLMLGRNIASLV